MSQPGSDAQDPAAGESGPLAAPEGGIEPVEIQPVEIQPGPEPVEPEPAQPVVAESVDPAPSAEPSPPAEAKDEISPLVPRSQHPWLESHPADPERIRFRAGKGLTVASKSGKFELTTSARVQLLYTLDHDREDDPSVGHSFQIRRARLVFGGHALGEHNKFKIELSLSPRDVGLGPGGTQFTIMRDYYLDFDYLRDLTVRIGQYKVPYSLQRVISSGKLQLNDRSIVGPEFDFDRDIGLDLRSEDFLGLDRLRYYAGVYFGGGRDSFAVEPVTRGGGLVYLARVEVLPFGTFDDYTEGDFSRSKKPRLALGGAYSYMDEATFNRGTKGKVPTDGGTTDYHNATASLAFQFAGLSVISEFFWRQGVRHPGDAQIEDDMGNPIPAPIEPPRNGMGWYAQAGYMIPRIPVEIAARFSQIHAVGSAETTSMSDKNELGGGLNWYIGGHAFKIQVDYFRLWDEVIGRGRDQVRAQLQLTF